MCAATVSMQSVWMTQCLIALAPSVSNTCLLREWIEDLHKSLPKAEREELNSVGVVKKYIARDGRKRICGGPRLKATQTYTRTFARAVAELHRRRTMKHHLKPVARRLGWTALPPVTPECMAKLDTWDDAKLDAVHAFIERRKKRLAIA